VPYVDVRQAKSSSRVAFAFAGFKVECPQGRNGVASRISNVTGVV